jgi:hypothetical protein
MSQEPQQLQDCSYHANVDKECQTPQNLDPSWLTIGQDKNLHQWQNENTHHALSYEPLIMGHNDNGHD